MGYSFSTLRSGQLFHKVGSRSSCYVYIVSVGQYANVFNCWTEIDTDKLRNIEFDAFSKSYWNDSAKLYYKVDKRYNEEITQKLCIKAIQSIFTYNEYYLKNSDNWGN